MATPRVFKRPHVDDPKLNKIFQQIDDEFSNVYQTPPAGSGSTGPTGPSVTGPTGPGTTGPTGPAGKFVTIPVISAGQSYAVALSRVNGASPGSLVTWVVPGSYDPGITDAWDGNGSPTQYAIWDWGTHAWIFSWPNDGDIIDQWYADDSYSPGGYMMYHVFEWAPWPPPGNADTVDYWHVKYTDEYGSFELFE